MSRILSPGSTQTITFEDLPAHRWKKAQLVAAKLRRLYKKKKRTVAQRGTASGPAQSAAAAMDDPQIEVETGQSVVEEQQQQEVPASVLSPHPMRPVASWLDEPTIAPGPAPGLEFT